MLIRFVAKLLEWETGFAGFIGLQDSDSWNPVNPANLDHPVLLTRNLATNRIGMKRTMVIRLVDNSVFGRRPPSRACVCACARVCVRARGHAYERARMRAPPACARAHTRPRAGARGRGQSAAHASGQLFPCALSRAYGMAVKKFTATAFDEANCECNNKSKTPIIMNLLILGHSMVVAAAGPAFLVWLFGGGFGLALLVFVLLKVAGR